MRLYDEFHRCWFEISKRRFQFRSFVIEYTEGNIDGWIIGFEEGWLTTQPKKYLCVDCKNYIPSPCHRVGEKEPTWWQDGEWSFWCHDIHYGHPI